jgi:hypothetical protein
MCVVAHESVYAYAHTLTEHASVYAYAHTLTRGALGYIHTLTLGSLAHAHLNTHTDSSFCGTYIHSFSVPYTNSLEVLSHILVTRRAEGLRLHQPCACGMMCPV